MYPPLTKILQEIFWKRSGNGDEQKSNGTGTVQERKNYCNSNFLIDYKLSKLVWLFADIF